MAIAPFSLKILKLFPIRNANSVGCGFELDSCQKIGCFVQAHVAGCCYCAVGPVGHCNSSLGQRLLIFGDVMRLVSAGKSRSVMVVYLGMMSSVLAIPTGSLQPVTKAALSSHQNHQNISPHWICCEAVKDLNIKC